MSRTMQALDAPQGRGRAMPALLSGFPPAARSSVDVLLLGPVFGLIVAAVVSLPSVLLYREVAAPIAALALIPATANRLDIGGLNHVLADSGSFDQFWPLACALMITAIFSHVCLVWVSRAPGEHTSRAA